MSRVFKVFLVVVLLVFLTPKIVYADEIYPDTAGVSYKVMRVKEKISLFFKFSPIEKEKFYETLLDRRLGELEHVVDNDRLFYLESTSQRYAATAGELSDLIIKNGLKDRVPVVKSKFSKDIETIKTLENHFDVRRGEWRLLEYSADSLKIYSDNISSF